MFVYGRSALIPSEHEQPPHPPATGFMLLFGTISTYLYIFILFCINFYILRKDNLSGREKTILSILVSIAVIIIWNQLFMFTQRHMFGLGEPDVRAVRGNMMRDILLGGLVVLTSHITNINYRRQVMTVENEALKAEYARARYEALKNQVDPHFLFNTLNTLSSVVTKDPQTAQKYIQKLSSIFRYTIQGKDVSSLENELIFTRDYCDLMQIRYGENLNFEFDILEKYKIYSVVPFSIQTLVENAIKHNVITNSQPLTVTISTEADDFLTVSNTINPKKDPEAGEGVGLANLSERYRLKWGEDIVINNDGKTFRVRIPMIHEAANINIDKL